PGWGAACGGGVALYRGDRVRGVPGRVVGGDVVRGGVVRDRGIARLLRGVFLADRRIGGGWRPRALVRSGGDYPERGREPERADGERGDWLGGGTRVPDDHPGQYLLPAGVRLA